MRLSTIRNAVALVRVSDWRALESAARGWLWSDRQLLGFRCDLSRLPSPSPAKIPVLMRGCARVGFELDHLMVIRRRLGVQRTRLVPADEEARMAWAGAIAPAFRAVVPPTLI